MTLQQSGSTITGNLITPDGTPGAVTGQLNGTTLTMSRNTGLDTIQLYEVAIRGNTFSGSYRNDGKVRDSGSFTGTRTAGPDISGIWNVVFAGRTATTMNLRQNGSSVTGNVVTPDGTPGDVTGTFDGTTLTLVRNTGLDTIQHYQVTVQGDSFSGAYQNEGKVSDRGSFTGSRAAAAATQYGGRGVVPPRRPMARTVSAERALDACRAEVHARATRDYGLSDIDVTSIGIDMSQGRRNWVTGTFTEGSGTFLRGSDYRFNCSMDFSTGQVTGVTFLRADGSAVPLR
jgi:hypothetical protein